jgi:hypothetical protein
LGFFGDAFGVKGDETEEQGFAVRAALASY